MEFEEFEEKLRAAQQKHAPPGRPPELHPFDSWTASDEDIARVQEELGSTLPRKYTEFMRRHGGGQFLFVDLLPVLSHDGTEDDLVTSNREINATGFIAVAPVGTGDWWGFHSVKGECGDEVIFLDHEDGSTQLAAADFLEFLSAQALG
ncbi:SMI1/KNR4 family protein [Streptomyces sp. NPDC054796]